MKTLYNLSIGLYRLAIYISSFFNKKAHLFRKGRTSLFQQLTYDLKSKPGDYIWFHCASLGEFEQGRPLIETIRKEYPQYKIIVSFFSPSGYEVRKKYTHADIVCYLPLDTASNAERFISLLNPKAAFFIKYEFWYHFLTHLKKKSIPTYLVSGIFRPTQIHFQSYGRFFRNTLSCFNHFFVQDTASGEILEKNGFPNYLMSGDTRFDRVAQVYEEKREIDYMERFSHQTTIFVSGSTWPEDETVLAPIINSKLPLKHIIAPHEVSNSRLEAIEKILQKPFIRYSEIRGTTHIENFEVIIIDSVGILSHLYKYANYAYIGGAFGKGLHNILEAATFGMPLFFGSNYTKFNEAIELVERKGAFPINKSEELNHHLSDFISDKSKKSSCNLISKSYVQSNRGATRKVIDYCKAQGVL